MKKIKNFFEIIPNNLGANYLKNEKNEKNFLISFLAIHLTAIVKNII